MRKVDPVKHAEKRRQILEAAGRCFAREGFHGATTAAICAEAGISPGHLYHYFASKEAIIEALVDANLKRLEERFGAAAETSGVVATLASEVDQKKLKQIRGARSMLLDIFAEAERNPAMAEVIHKHSRGMLTLTADLVRKGQEAGEIDRTLDADVVATVLMSVIDGTKIIGIRDPKLETGKTFELVKTMITRFLAPQPTRK